MPQQDPVGITQNIDEAVKTLPAYCAQDITTIMSRSEDEFLTLAYFAAGTFMQNSWCLFWFEGYRHSS